jgi:hypothetical protein
MALRLSRRKHGWTICEGRDSPRVNFVVKRFLPDGDVFAAFYCQTCRRRHEPSPLGVTTSAITVWPGGSSVPCLRYRRASPVACHALITLDTRNEHDLLLMCTGSP